MGAGAKIWGWYKAGKKWVEIQVDNEGRVIVDMSAISPGDIGDIDLTGIADGDVLYWDAATSLWKPKKVDKTNLSQDFGASSARLLNLIPVAKTGYALRIDGAASSVFSAKINGAPTATLVVYDTDANEDMFFGLLSGADYWGRIVLHNTTRGNSRKIVNVDRTTNTIATDASVDDWADNDDITCQSQTNVTAGYFDLDLSNKIAATDIVVVFYISLLERAGVADVDHAAIFHPYEAYDVGKRTSFKTVLANDANTAQFFMPVIDQKITIQFRHFATETFILSVVGTMEYADT